jgi:hypothetical protein
VILTNINFQAQFLPVTVYCQQYAKFGAIDPISSSGSVHQAEIPQMNPAPLLTKQNQVPPATPTRFLAARGIAFHNRNHQANPPRTARSIPLPCSASLPNSPVSCPIHLDPPDWTTRDADSGAPGPCARLRVFHQPPRTPRRTPTRQLSSDQKNRPELGAS